MFAVAFVGLLALLVLGLLVWQWWSGALLAPSHAGEVRRSPIDNAPAPSRPAAAPGLQPIRPRKSPDRAA